MSEDARLITPAADITPRDEVARAALGERTRFPAPRDGFVEQVYRHELSEPHPPRVTASIVNPGFTPTGGIGVSVSWDPRQLPRMWQWRMLGPGMYLTGLEPANCGLAGRAAEREAGSIEELEPGAVRKSGIHIRISLGSDAQALARSVDPT